jgi:sugar-specific transcriptional regulator TrmB
MANDECLGCGKKFTKKDASVKCSICHLWCHKTCSCLTDDFFKCLAEQFKATNRAYWACRSCSNYAEGMNHRLREIQNQASEAVRIGTENKEEITKLKEQLAKEKERADNAVLKVEKELQEEMTRREERRKNIIIHGLSESSSMDGKKRMEDDKNKLDDIFIVLDVNVAAENDVEFCRRVGERSDRPRPLVVGFYMEWSKEIVMKHAKRLISSHLNEVTIVPDLTDKQRKAERELEGEADRRNREELSQDDVAKNLTWRVVGKIGQKRLMKTYNIGSEQRGGWTRGRAATRGVRARGAAARGGSLRGGATASLGVQLLPARGSNHTSWTARHRGTGRAAEQRQEEQETERSSSRKRTRQGSNEEQLTQTKKRGRPPRGAPRASPVRMGEEEQEEEQETDTDADMVEDEELLTQPTQQEEEEGREGEEEEGLRLGESQQ